MNATARKTVLMIEDVEDNRGIMRQLAARIDVALLEAGNGLEGLSLARTTLPDLIVMDMSLPVLDGWEATRRLRIDPATAHIPIIAVTAHAMAGDREKALACGCDEYVAKPVDVVTLRALLERYLLDPRP